ncbi:caspase family protein [uncultured Kordia sp.]|uniref:caspase family protein n=1 Tax=uncultured Kordia sp. TaxID=507699 RepID=UPI002618A4D0|nr:caspase family protein [uncultured Kordia sp.]
MRRALLIGINDYPKNPLTGCENDALRMQSVLKTHENGDANFDCKILLSSKRSVTRSEIRKNIKKLFNHEKGTALLYFSGHGATTVAGTYLVSQDAKPEDVGVSLLEIVAIANNSKADEVIIILDCCYAGDAGNSIDLNERKVILREGVSILAAASADQYSYEKNGGGIFTNIIYDALKGSAADVRGKITLSGIYYTADVFLNAWNQRPVFKSHVSHMISLRNCTPKISLKILRKLPTYFDGETTGITLSPNYVNTKTPLAVMMKHLQKYQANGLLEPIEASTLHEAALNNKSCCLTALGNYYKSLAIQNRL